MLDGARGTKKLLEKLYSTGSHTLDGARGIKVFKRTT